MRDATAADASVIGAPPLGGYDADVLILALDRPDEALAAVA
jgi:hypothetical protein